MSLPRLGCLHPTRLSFTRTLVRRMHREGWRIRRALWEMDEKGYGTAVYVVDGAGAPLSFVAFTQALDPALRTDRVIATQWDAAFALMAGEPDDAEVERLRASVPRQEAGRMGEPDIVLSRANKSVRLFDHVCERLAHGVQPDMAQVNAVGYLMRTTAVYGNGKFGLADMSRVHAAGVFRLPYQAEMLAVYLARELSMDLVEHVARCRAPDTAVPLAPKVRRALGVGNATGLGMAPFLIKHPQLINRWMEGREQALARVKARPWASETEAERFSMLLERCRRHVAQWRTDDARQQQRIHELVRDLDALWRSVDHIRADLLRDERPWAGFSQRVQANHEMETQELMNALLIELFPESVDDLENTLGTPESKTLDPRMPVPELKRIIEASYAFALSVDFSEPSATARFWYVSQDKAEPRLGERGVDAGDELETRIDIARQVQQLYRALRSLPQRIAEGSVAGLALHSPALRGIVARVQSVAALPYAEIHGNLVGEECLPIDLLRAKLACFGAGKFDPKSDRWTRITLFQGAPPASELAASNADDWWMPVLPERL